MKEMATNHAIATIAPIHEKDEAEGCFRPKDRIGPGVNKGNRPLIDATKPIENPRSEDYWGEKFAVVAYPDNEIMDKVRKDWDTYKIN